MRLSCQALLVSFCALWSLALPAGETTTPPEPKPAAGEKSLDWPTLDGKDLDWPTLRAIPRVPAMPTITQGTGTLDSKVGNWVQSLIKAKEKKAKIEVTMLKRKLQEEQSAFQAEERERVRRQERYETALGGTTAKPRDSKRAVLRMKLDFQVPEIETYRRITEVIAARQALMTDIVETLSRLDLDGDGKLTGEEYRDAGSLWAATQKLFKPLDADGDGYLSTEEIEAGAAQPAGASAAISAGRDLADATGFRIRSFDEDKDNVLTVAERKALTMAYVEVGLRCEQEAAFYKRLSDDLTVARQVAATKFAELQLDQ